MMEINDEVHLRHVEDMTTSWWNSHGTRTLSDGRQAAEAYQQKGVFRNLSSCLKSRLTVLLSFVDLDAIFTISN